MSIDSGFSDDKYKHMCEYDKLLELASAYSSMVDPHLIDKKFTQRAINDLLTGKVDDFDEHLEKLKKENKKGPFREYVDLSNFSVYSVDNNDKVKIIIEDNNTDEDCTDSLIRKFNAYDIMSCTISVKVAEMLLDKDPLIFNGVMLHYVEDELPGPSNIESKNIF